MDIADKKYFFYDFYKKLFYSLKFFLFFLPVSVIIGNSAININCFIIIIIYLLIFFSQKGIFSKYKKIFYIFIFFISLSLINIYFSDYKDLSIISTSGILRYFIVMMAFLYCLENDNKFLLIFSKILFFVLLLVSLDTLLQYFSGEDIFGNVITSSHGKRLAGPFGDEYIVGAYLSKLAFISVFFLIDKNKKYHLILYLLFTLLVVILSNERMASIMFIITFFIYFIFSINFSYKKKIIFISILISALTLLFLFNKDLKNHFINHTFDQIGLTQKGIVLNEQPHYSVWDSQWGAHFLTAYEIFKSKPILGSGIKSFRVECRKAYYEKINSAEYKARCNTHPHNIYFEILAETGILIFVPFVLLNLILTYKLIYILFYRKKLNDFNLLIFCSYTILFFPIQTTGAFFSTWNGLFYWVIYSFVAYALRKKT
jgi:O-antigen ligase